MSSIIEWESNLIMKLLYGHCMATLIIQATLKTGCLNLFVTLFKRINMYTDGKTYLIQRRPAERTHFHTHNPQSHTQHSTTNGWR